MGLNLAESQLEQISGLLGGKFNDDSSYNLLSKEVERLQQLTNKMLSL